MNKLRALIIDDNPTNVAVLAELLALEGINYTKLLDSTRLDVILQDTVKFDIIFLDLEMPILDGYAVLELLKASAYTRTLPVVAYTVHISEIGIARKLGFHSFLGKPLDADQFPGQLARILNGERVWAAA